MRMTNLNVINLPQIFVIHLYLQLETKSNKKRRNCDSCNQHILLLCKNTSKSCHHARHNDVLVHRTPAKKIYEKHQRFKQCENSNNNKHIHMNWVIRSQEEGSNPQDIDLKNIG